MALGFTFNSGEDFLPIVKYDARAGRISRRDRVNNENTDIDITRSFKAVFDFENIETGWIVFPAGAAPDFRLAPHGSGIVVQKPGDNYKQGFRMMVKLGKECGGDIREFASNAAACLEGINKLHDDYLLGVNANPGKLPVVVLKDSIATTKGSGEKKSTNYVPVFEITGWVARPQDLVHKPRSASASPAPAGASAGAPAGAPPATGSTVAPPPAAAAAPAPAMVDDFG
jgi:hypothetical protein